MSDKKVKTNFNEARKIWQTSLLRKNHPIKEIKLLRKSIGLYEKAFDELPIELQKRLKGIEV